MQFLGHFCLLVVVCSVLELYKRILQVFLELFLMDFATCLNFLTQSGELKSGLLLLGCFSPTISFLSLFLMFSLGLKYLQTALHRKGLLQFLCEIRGKSGNPRIGFFARKDFDQVCDKKIISCEPSSLKCVENSKENVMVSQENTDCDAFDDDADDGYRRKYWIEDEEFDVMALRRLVKIERQRADMANLELEKERMASASAADEAMAMILRLQREKSCIEIESSHHYKLAEQMQEYDQEVIQSLQWIIVKYESERTVLEEKLSLCKQKLKQYMKSDEMDQFEMSLDVDTAIEDGSEDVQTNSVEKYFSLLGLLECDVIQRRDGKQLKRLKKDKIRLNISYAGSNNSLQTLSYISF
ncbi:protein FLOURY 1-like [Ricinus communis]|uniref:protein FLOURY 1-like n=1 Tax=Ricinus communis TaxID=3988 RepID=UPI00201A3EB0|nr:protein FLOURY 1-like [Ricinus communis]